MRREKKSRVCMFEVEKMPENSVSVPSSRNKDGPNSATM